MKLRAHGVEIHYTLEGPAGAPVVTLSHSIAADLTMWDPTVPALTPRYRVLRYDVRGHGGSEATAGEYGLEQLAGDARALLGALGIARTHCVGLSLGGMIGQALALDAPGAARQPRAVRHGERDAPELTPVWDERMALVDAGGAGAQPDDVRARWFTPGFVASHPDVVAATLAMIGRRSPRGSCRPL